MEKFFDFDAVDKLHESQYYGPDASQAREFYWSSLLGALLSYRDLENRPLGEEIASKAARSFVSMEFKACGYPGSRHNHDLPMNVSSLKQFVRHWNKVIAGIGTLRNAYLSKRKKSFKDNINVIDLWIISRLCQILPAYLVRREHDPIIDGQIPVVPAIIYRMALGLHRIVHIYLVKELTLNHSLDRMITPNELYLLAEQRGLLVGNHSVCAGPQAMIEQSYQAMLKTESISSEGLDHLVDDNFLAYGYLSIRLDIEKYIFAVRGTFILYDLIDQLAPYIHEPFVEKFRQALIKFEDWSAKNTSPLAHEIARQDVMMLVGGEASEDALKAAASGNVRQSMMSGLENLRNELHNQYNSYKKDGKELTDLIKKQATIVINEEVKKKVHEFFTDLGYHDLAFKKVADALVEYLRLEAISIGIFELIQTQIDECLQRFNDPKLLMTSADIFKVFGPKFRDFVAEFFSIDIQNSAKITKLKSGDKEVIF